MPVKSDQLPMQNAFACIGPLHEGLPDWFPDVVGYVLRSLQGRDRFNLYNVYRSINTGICDRLYTKQLREAFTRLEGQGLRFIGRHSQKVVLDKQLVAFWSNFLAPARISASYDLSIFFIALSGWRFNELILNPILKAFLLPGYRSLPKKSLILHLMRTLFGTPYNYANFVSLQSKRLSSMANELYKVLSEGPKLMKEINLHSAWTAAYELCRALLVYPSYITIEKNIYLKLDVFRGFETPRQIHAAKIKPLTEIGSCLEPIRIATTQLLQGENTPYSTRRTELTFPERQLALLKEEGSDCYEQIQILIEWWAKAVGTGTLPRETLLKANFCLTRSAAGMYCPLILTCEINYILDIAEKFMLLRKCEDSRLAITPLGQMLAGKKILNHEMESVWARNLDRLTLRPGKGWNQAFYRLLGLIATKEDGGCYVVTPASLAKSRFTFEQIVVIIGGFTRLEARRGKRLQSWINRSHTEKLCPATAFPRSEEWIAERLHQLLEKHSDWRMLYTKAYIVVIGPSPKKLRSILGS